MKKNSPIERIWNGIFVENPVFVLVLGTCPTLATTTSATNAIGMGLSTLVVLALANLFISLLRNVIPSQVRMVRSLPSSMELVWASDLPSLFS